MRVADTLTSEDPHRPAVCAMGSGGSAVRVEGEGEDETGRALSPGFQMDSPPHDASVGGAGDTASGAITAPRTPPVAAARNYGRGNAPRDFSEVPLQVETATFAGAPISDGGAPPEEGDAPPLLLHMTPPLPSYQATSPAAAATPENGWPFSGPENGSIPIRQWGNAPTSGERSTLNPHPSTFTPQPSTLSPHPSTLAPRPSTLNPKPETRNPNPEP